MKLEKIYISGVTVDLTQPKDQIGLFIKFANLTTKDAPLVNDASVEVDDKGGCITIQRDLRYNMQGNVLIDLDCSLIFGLEPACFGIDPFGKFKDSYAEKGIPVPYIPVPIPYVGNWYIGKDEAAEAYQKCFQMATGVKIKDIKFIASESELKIEFKWLKDRKK